MHLQSRGHRPRQLGGRTQGFDQQEFSCNSARSHPGHEHLQRRLCRLHSFTSHLRSLSGSACPQRQRRLCQQGCRFGRLQQLRTAQAYSPCAWRQIPLRDQRGCRSSYHQHHQQPDQLGRRSAPYRSRGKWHAQLHLQRAERRSAHVAGNQDGT